MSDFWFGVVIGFIVLTDFVLLVDLIKTIKVQSKIERKEVDMSKINLNDIAKEITLEEGGELNLSIAQVKEVLRIILKKYALEILVQMWLQENKQ